jgi:hypothetical protein
VNRERRGLLSALVICALLAPACSTPASPADATTIAAGTTTPAPTASAVPRFITGMEVVDVIHNSETRGLKCDSGQSVTIEVPTPRTARQWRCQGAIIAGVGVVVTAIGDDQSHIERVLVGVVQTIPQPSDAIAGEVLGFYATMPYKDAEPTRSREWVKANVAAAPPASLEVGQGRIVVGKVDARTHTMEIRSLAFVAQ